MVVFSCNKIIMAAEQAAIFIPFLPYAGRNKGAPLGEATPVIKA
jgi:hypothetical protein